jgi:hypothetical protein
MNGKIFNLRAVVVLIVTSLLAIASIGLFGWFLGTIPEERFTPEIVLPMMLLAGIVSLIAMLGIAVSLFAALGLATSSEAFGLPEGSVRAVIALGLILIFALMGVFLYGGLQRPPTGTLTGISQEQLNAIPGNEIVSSRPSELGENLFEVERQLHNEASEDFAQQLLTTVSTLVVAVAGFYFGTRAVAAAKETAIHPTLRLLSPASPAELGKDMTKLPIRLETKPAGLAIEGRVNGYFDESLKQIRYDEFEYQRSAEAPSGPVVLSFSLFGYPDVTQTLQVDIELPADETQV